MTYEEAKAYKQELEEINNEHSNTLNTFDKNSIGLTSDHVRKLPEWQNAKNEFNSSFAELRKFNGWYVKTFKKEIITDRRKRYKQN